ncbi:hypothetical protein DAEQUDRAFT_720718 [Daedalea quercina L-15889]|uniref:Uncharacterized protein n=1 Tax=Daedalea quercina L-15889 TaxID=1314783 RepID=A0A165U8A2_9APHY|nr:hypothetical protein DAEQUDRAFT_720718 [Daedalea quercina L-15889]
MANPSLTLLVTSLTWKPLERCIHNKHIHQYHQSPKAQKLPITKKRLVFDGVVIPVPSRLSAPESHGSSGATHAYVQDASPAHESAREPEDHDITLLGIPSIECDRVHASPTSSGTEAPSAERGQCHKLRRRPQTPWTTRDTHSGSSTRNAAAFGTNELIADVDTIDRLLGAQWAPTVLIPGYAEPRSVAWEVGLRFNAPTVATMGHTDGRGSWRSYSMPRWSRTAMLKERLDTRLGAGDFNRALYKRPKPGTAQVQPERTPNDVICADESNGDAVSRAQRGKRPRSPEIGSTGTTMDDASEAATAEGSRPMKRHMSCHSLDPRDASEDDGPTDV